MVLGTNPNPDLEAPSAIIARRAARDSQKSQKSTVHVPPAERKTAVSPPNSPSYFQGGTGGTRGDEYSLNGGTGGTHGEIETEPRRPIHGQDEPQIKAPAAGGCCEECPRQCGEEELVDLQQEII